MAKKAPKSNKPGSSSASAAASSKATPTTSSSGGKMVLRFRTNESLKRSGRQNVVNNEKEKKKPRSATNPKGKLNKKNVKLDPKMPKKPPTAFFYFLEDFSKEFQVHNPDVKSMRDIGKACGEKWKTMTYKEKVKYYDIATEKRADFDRAMAEYIKRKGER